MGIGNMITKLFNKKESNEKTVISKDGYQDFDSIIPSPKLRTKSFLINRTINFYSHNSGKPGKKSDSETSAGEE